MVFPVLTKALLRGGFFSLVMFFLLPTLVLARPEGLREVRLVRVVDGDTIVVARLGGEETHIRLLGIDCLETRRTKRQRAQAAELGLDPESALSLGEETTSFVEDRLRDRPVYLEFEPKFKDKYRRQLAYVWFEQDMGAKEAQSTLLNLELLETGRAKIYDKDSRRLKYAEQFEVAETAAREENRGFWGDGNKPPLPSATVPSELPESLESLESPEPLRPGSTTKSRLPESTFPWRVVLIVAGIASLLVGWKGAR